MNHIAFPPPNLPGELARHIIVQGECWIWRGPLNRNGYGRCGRKYGQRVAHRVIYEILVCEIPSGMVLDHRADRCTSRACCNPAHMDPVTPRVNTLRGQSHLMFPAHLGWLKCRGLPKELPLGQAYREHLAAEADAIPW